MAGELHSPPDDGARARADDVDDEQLRATELADRIASYAPAGSDCRPPRVGWSCLACGAASDRQSCARCGAECAPAAVPSVSLLPEMEARALRAEAEVARLRGVLSAHGLDPDCSLCAAGHVPARPCGRPGTVYDAGVALWGEDPLKWPTYLCGGCGQRNVGWELTCARCGELREVPAGPHGEVKP